MTLRFSYICVLLALQYYVVNSKLELVQVFFRHGSRAPSEKEMYPNNPHIDYWRKIGFEELTSLGRQQSVQLGKLLRNKYQSFISNDYNPEEIMTKSSEYNRTRETASLVLDGIFSLTNRSGAPYVIHYKKLSKDYEFTHPSTYCNAFANELICLINSIQFQEVESKYKNMFAIISKKTGKEYNSLEDLYFLFQVLYSERYINLANPEWVHLYKKLQEISVYELYIENSTSKLKRLNGGQPVKNIIENMKKTITNRRNPTIKMILNSGHDVNIVNIQATMGTFTPHFPNYNAANIVELHYNSDLKKYFVKVFYIKHVDDEATELFIKDCGNPCELNKFEEVMHPYLPLNYTQECESKVLLE